MSEGMEKRTKGKHVYLSEAEKEWLRANYATAPMEEMTARLGCTRASLWKRAVKMGLKRGAEALRATRSEMRVKAWRRARLRYTYGMETRGCWTLRPFSTTDGVVRCLLGKKGYILGDYKLASERWTIFYDGETERVARLERWAERRGFAIKELTE